MKKWWIAAAALGVLLLGYLAAGPFLTVNAIRDAVKAQNMPKLSRHVDFPALRGSLKLQLDDYLVRRAGPEVQSNAFGAIALRIASGVASGTVDAMVTPAGLAAIMGGRNMWQRASGGPERVDRDAPPPDPLEGARYRFESPSRFTATVVDDSGQPVVFVLTRSGLAWKLSDVRLPLETPGDATEFR